MARYNGGHGVVREHCGGQIAVTSRRSGYILCQCVEVPSCHCRYAASHGSMQSHEHNDVVQICSYFGANLDIGHADSELSKILVMLASIRARRF
jgi:hypothetical protein